MERDRIKVGLVLDGMAAPEWKARLIQLLRDSEDAEIRLAVLWAPTKTGPDDATAGWRHALYRWAMKMEKRLVRPQPDAFAPRDVAALLEGVPTLTVRPASGQDGQFPEGDADRIAQYGLDVLLLPGGGDVTGKILQAARYGVWVLRHGQDPTSPSSGSPQDGAPGFWEVFEGRPVTGAALEALGAAPDESLTLKRTWTATAPLSVARNQHNTIWKTLHLVPRALHELRRLGGERFLAEARRAAGTPKIQNPAKSIPNNVEFLGPLARRCWRYAAKRLIEALRFDQWFLLIAPGNDAPRLDPARFRRLLPPSDHFWADPFAVRRDGRHFIFFEDYPVREAKGRISVIELDADGNWSEPVAALERPYHLSYPFVFEWGGADWMIPETMANGTVELYRCTRWPDRWQFEKNLMTNIQAVDATLHHHGGKWWMFANVKESGEISENDELFLFYADSPLSDRWTAHPKNPVISDVRGARPAGRLFEKDGAIWRPSQVCAPDYGRAIRINRIVRWDEEDYEEAVVETIEPGWAQDVHGMHTMNFTDGLTVMDARRKKWK